MTLTWIEGSPVPTDVAVTDAYRPLRSLSESESPVAGVLTTVVGRDLPVVLVDAATAHPALWPSIAAEHVLTAEDVALRPDGHDLVLPWCESPLDRWLNERRAAGSPLSGGEVVTLAVSVLRGVMSATAVALATRGDVAEPGPSAEPEGRWWLTADGVPVFAFGSGVSARAGAQAVLQAARAGRDDRVLARVMARVDEALQRARILRRTLAEIEGELFESYAPQPLSPVAIVSDMPVRRSDEAVSWRPEVGGSQVRDLAERYVDARVVEIVSDAVQWVRLRLPVRRQTDPEAGEPPEPSKRVRPLMVAAVVGVVVVFAGVMWPSGDSSERVDAASSSIGHADDRQVPELDPAPDLGLEPTTEPPPAAASPAEPSSAESSSAEGAPAGETPVAASLDPVTEARAILQISDGTDVTLVDRYGDVAVIKLTTADGTESYTALELHRGRWRARQPDPPPS